MLHDELARLRLAPEDVLDVSVNVNPYGPCLTVIDAIRKAPLERYPDPTAAPARVALARQLDVASDRVVVGNGAVDLLWSIARALVRPGDSVVVVEPAFSELRTAAVRAGARIVEHRLAPEDDFKLDPAALAAAICIAKPRIVYLCTPANPTGASTSVAPIACLAREHPDTTFIVDISFLSLSSGHRDDVVHACDRIVWLRSLTKDLALAGLRVGLAVAPRELCASIESDRPPWSVNALAQAAAIAATTPQAQAFIVQSRTSLLEDRERLEGDLHRLGLRTHPSDTIYTLVDLGRERCATALRDAMLIRHAVLVRDGTSFGLPHHVRLGARPPPQQGRLLRALREELAR